MHNVRMVFVLPSVEMFSEVCTTVWGIGGYVRPNPDNPLEIFVIVSSDLADKVADTVTKLDAPPNPNP